MKKFAFVFAVLSLSMPLTAHAQQRMSEDELIQAATDRGVCGDRAVVSARYANETDNRVQVTCGEEAEGFVPLVAGLGGLGGVGAAAAGIAGLAAAAAAAGGGGGSTPDTQ